MNVASQPVLWAGLAGIWLSTSGTAMPRMVCAHSVYQQLRCCLIYQALREAYL